MLGDYIIKNIILFKGGLGKHIAVSGVFENYFQNNPEDVLCINYKNVYDNLNIHNIIYNLSFSLLKDNQLKIIEPYTSYEVYNQEQSIVNISNLLLINENEYILPKFILTDTEIEEGYNFLKENDCLDFKSAIMFQPFGNGFNHSSMKDESFRSINFKNFESIIQKYKKDFKILILRSNDIFPIDKSCIDISFWGFRKIAGICYHLDKFIGCDSFLNHLIPAMNKSAFIFWINTSEKVFGHTLNINYREKNGQKMIPLEICKPEIVTDSLLNLFDNELLFTQLDNYLK